MKRNQIVIIGIAVLIVGLIYFALVSNRKEEVKSEKELVEEMFVPVKEVKNEIRKMEIISYGQVTPISEINVSFEVQGKLQKGSITMKPGVKFSKGTVLYSVDNSEAKYTLSARKTSLANLIIQVLPDLELDFPDQTNKWIEFLNKVRPDELLPSLPTFGSGKERMFMTSRNIVSEYYNIKSLEERFKKYVYVAPFSGTVVTVSAEPGSIVNPGTPIAMIAKTGDFEVKVPIDVDLVDTYKSKAIAEFTDSDHRKIGTGSIIRISDVINQRTQSADVYYNIKPKSDIKIYNGMFLNAKINQQADISSMPIPRMAMKDNQVMILENDQLVPYPVQVVSSKPDTIFVSGLKDGSLVVLEQIQASKDIKKFKGIKL